MATDAGMAADTPDTGVLHFPLQDNEKVLSICRKHWIYLWPRTFLLALWAFLPLIIVGGLLSWVDWLEGTVLTIFAVAALVWLVFWGVRAFLNWYVYQNDIWVLTNQRIVDSKKRNPFSLRISTADLVNIQDMTVDRSGILKSMLNYGDIICETASSSEDFVLGGIPDPQQVQLMVDRERDRERRGGR